MSIKLVVASSIMIFSLQGSTSYAAGFGGFLEDFTGLVDGLAGVAGVPSNNKVTKLQRDQRRTKVEGGIIGVVGGALLGRAIGGKKGMAKGALIGTVLGVVAGNKVAKAKKRAALTQDSLNRQIAALNADIHNARKHNQNSQKYALIVRKRIVSLGRNKRGRLSLAKELSNVIKNKQNIIKQQTFKLKKHQALIATAKSQARQKKERINSIGNDNRVAILKKEIILMKNQVNTLAHNKTNLLANQS